MLTDHLIDLSLHESMVQSLVTFLQALADLAEPGSNNLPAGLRSYLMQALDNAADLDLLFGVLADAMEQGIAEGGR